jgi:hypothetical protein
MIKNDKEKVSQAMRDFMCGVMVSHLQKYYNFKVLK